MTLFIKQLIRHALILLAVLSAFVFVYIYQLQRVFILPSSVCTVILGDSRTQNGVDDSLLENAVNFSSPAESYVYAFNKLRYITEHSCNVRNVVLAFSHHNVSSEIDDRWIHNPKNRRAGFGSLFPLFSADELWLFFASGSLASGIRMLESAAYYSMYSIEIQVITRAMPFTGGYTKNDKVYKPNNDSPNSTAFNGSSSELQLSHLRKIQDLCKTKQISLFLLNTPVVSSSFDKDIGVYVNDESTYLDWSRLELPTNLFADNNHLNPEGAHFLTRRLAEAIAAVEGDANPTGGR